MTEIYLDYNISTPVDGRVAATMRPLLDDALISHPAFIGGRARRRSPSNSRRSRWQLCSAYGRKRTCSPAGEAKPGFASGKIMLVNALERLRWGQRLGCGGLGPDLEASMSLRPILSGDVPALTATIARAAFPRDNPYLHLRNRLGAIFTDAQFVPRFAHCEQRAECRGGWRL